MPIRILIVDDHTVVRHGLRMFLALDPEFEIIGEATNGAKAVELTQKLRPDVVLMDLLMPVMDGIAATAAIRRELLEVEVIALTSVLNDDKVVGAARATSRPARATPELPSPGCSPVRGLIDLFQSD